MKNKYKQIQKKMRIIGEGLKEAMRHKRTFTTKSERQHYVTEYDIKADNELVKLVKKLFPQDSITSEENPEIKGTSDFCWFIDPISNTRNFIHGLPGFAISVGVMNIKTQESVAGFVYDPLLDEMFTAETGKGAFLNNDPIHVSDIKYGEHAFINADWQKRRTYKEIEEGMDIFTKVGRECTVRAVGSVALMVAYTAMGRLDGMVNNYSDRFALVPAWPIIREAGGEILDLQGKKWNLKSTSTFVTNNKITEGILLCLKK
ncbi:MAG: inositol monophosphatase family protein [Patescibacteria group bacterium]